MLKMAWGENGVGVEKSDGGLVWRLDQERMKKDEEGEFKVTSGLVLIFSLGLH